MPTRARPPATPCAISSALETEWLGTKPRVRAAAASRLPAATTRPSRDRAGWQPAQSAYGRSGWQARPERYDPSARGSLAAAPSAAPSAADASCRQGVEQRAIGLVDDVRERAGQRVDEHEGSVLAHRKRVAPQPQGESERQRRRRERVQRLAREVGADPRHTEDECVDRLVEVDRAQLDRPQQRLRVGDRGRASERRGRDEGATLVAQDAPSKAAREERVEPSERRPRDVLERCGMVREAAEASGEAGVVEDEGDAEQLGPSGECGLDGERELPGRLAGSLHERAGSGRAADGRRVARGEQGARAAAHDRLRGGDRHHDVRLGERARDGGARAVLEVELDEARFGRVVDDDLPPELACLGRRQQLLELASRQASLEPSCDENRLPLVRHAERGELGDQRCEGARSRVEVRSRHGQRGRLDHDRHARPGSYDVGERRTVEREPQRVADGRLRVGHASGRARREENDGLVVDGHVHDPRAGEERDAAHVPQSTSASEAHDRVAASRGHVVRLAVRAP